MAAVIQIKRSTGSSVPSLAQGELAYSGALAGGLDDGNGKLYIGSPGTTASLVIGGTFYTNLLSATAGTASASKAVILDAQSSVSGLGTVAGSTFTGSVSVAGGNVQLSGNTVSSTDTNGNLNLAPNGTGTVQVYGGTGDSWSLPRSRGTSTFVLTTNADGTTSWAPSVATLSFSNGATTSTVNLLTQTFTLLGGNGITTSVSGQNVTIEIDTGEGGLVTTTGTQTLTNKTMSGANNTFTNIGNASLSNSSATINGLVVELGGSISLTSTNIAEGTNLYYTDARARAAVTATTSGTGFGGLTYDSASGTFTFAKVTADDVRGTLAAANTAGFGSLAYSTASGTFTFTAVTAGEVRGTLAVANAGGGYGSLGYDAVNGTFTFTTVSDSDIRNRMSAATTATGYGNLEYSAGGTFTFTKITDADIRGSLTATQSAEGLGSFSFDRGTGTFNLNRPTAGEVRGTLSSTNTGGGFGAVSYSTTTGEIAFATVTAGEVRGTLSSTNTGTGFGAVSYSSSTGEISFAKVTDTEIRGTLSAGTGVTYNTTSGQISIGQNVATTASVTFNNVTITATTFSQSTDVVNKGYVDSVAQGLDAKGSVVAATTASITLSGTPQTIDGITIADGMRVLVKNQANPAENGIWVASASAWTRADDMSTGDEFPGAFTFVEQGTTYKDTGWVCTTNAPVTPGTTAIEWTQFSSAGQFTAGDGLQLNGLVFSVNPTLAGDGLAYSSGVMSVKVNTATLVITGDTVDIAAGGVTNTMLQNSGLTFTGTSGSTSVALGSSLSIVGGSAPITTAGTGGTITINVADASTASKGLASFSSTNFSVADGAVSIKAGGVSLTTDVTGTLPAVNGGTGMASYAVGDIVYANSTQTLSALTATGTGFALISAGVNTAPTYGKIGLTTHVDGTLAVANGGTGRAALTATQLLIGDGTNAVAQSANLKFEATANIGSYSNTQNVLTVGKASIGTSGNDVVIAAPEGTNGNIVLVPGGSGFVDIGGPNSGSSSLGSSSGENLNITGGAGLTLTANTTLTLVTTSSDIVMSLGAGTGTKVTISGPSAADYATGITDNDLVNALWVKNYAVLDGGTY